MARSTPVKKALRSLTWLAVIIVGLIALNGAGVLFAGSSWAPKLALDLEGGTQIILAPKLESGQTVSAEQLDQAVSIIRQRIDARLQAFGMFLAGDKRDGGVESLFVMLAQRGERGIACGKRIFHRPGNCKTGSAKREAEAYRQG